jgi:apolipoprotein D and lipocalin family protein
MNPITTYALATWRLRKAATTLVLASLSAGCASPSYAPLPTVAAVDLPRYMGAWYEVASLPNKFQAMCVADTQARYTLNSEEVTVNNRCRTEKGEVTAAEGFVKVVEGSANAKLKVSFFRPFYGDYWVLALDPDYQWVLVGVPSRELAWVLSRKPALDATVLDGILAKAAALGFERAAFKKTPQTQPLAP